MAVSAPPLVKWHLERGPLDGDVREFGQDFPPLDVVIPLPFGFQPGELRASSAPVTSLELRTARYRARRVDHVRMTREAWRYQGWEDPGDRFWGPTQERELLLEVWAEYVP